MGRGAEISTCIFFSHFTLHLSRVFKNSFQASCLNSVGPNLKMAVYQDGMNLDYCSDHLQILLTQKLILKSLTIKKWVLKNHKNPEAV
jgi:hypothetical protein